MLLRDITNRKKLEQQLIQSEITPWESKMPKIEILESRCKGCGLCTIACPHKLVTLSTVPNSMGYTVAVFSNPEKCTGCALCAEMCPDVAITVFKEQRS